MNYIHPRETQYIYSGAHTCSPSLLKLPNGVLLASHDVYQKDGGQNLTILYRSYDGGAHWHFVTELFPCCWEACSGMMEKCTVSAFLRNMETCYWDALMTRARPGPAPIVLGYGACCGSQNGFQKAPFPRDNLWGTVVDHGGIWFLEYRRVLLSDF
ncbi:MAG: sialidase family protein [Clostridia bacterium]